MQVKPSGGEDDESREFEAALESKARMAARIAAKAEGYEEKAFEILFGHLLKESSPPGGPTEGLGGPPAKPRGSGAVAAPRGAPRATVGALERVSEFLSAKAELVSEVSVWMAPLNVRLKLYGILRVARDKFGLDGLTLVELRSISQGKLRLGIPDPTLRSTLSTAPASELGKERAENGQTLFRLMRPGDAALDAAIAKGATVEVSPPGGSPGGDQSRPPPSSRQSKRIASNRGSPTMPAVETTRIAPILNADPALVAKYVRQLDSVGNKYEMYGILRFARDEFQIDGLLMGEIVTIASQPLRIPRSYNTRSSQLSKTPPNEIGRRANASGQQVFTILPDGERALDSAIKRRGASNDG